MLISEYWIGKDIDLDRVWDDYEDGLAYIDKFHTMQVHLIEFTFLHPDPELPLFAHEAIFKTFKAYFHEVKLRCLSRSDYDRAGPLFLYEISRGSAD